MGTEPQNCWNRLAVGLIVLVAGCASQPDAACLIGLSESGAYLLQLRPNGPFPSQCPQGTQYQMVFAQRYAAYLSESPATIVFFLAGSSPVAAAEASGEFTSFRVAPPSDVCTIPQMTPALDDRATPVNAATPVGPTTYTFSDVRVLSDAEHRGNQFEARALVDYGIPGCGSLEYVAQGVYPMTPCRNDSVCLPDPVGTEVAAPAGRGNGSQLNRDYRSFCNLDPALLDNPELASPPGPEEDSLSGAGRDKHTDDQGNLYDVGICFLSEPFPSLCPPGSTLSTTGPCVYGPGSNPH
jgi:hypothetical protein